MAISSSPSSSFFNTFSCLPSIETKPLSEFTSQKDFEICLESIENGTLETIQQLLLRHPDFLNKKNESDETRVQLKVWVDKPLGKKCI